MTDRPADRGAGGRGWALVAGGSGGIGAAICAALAEDGWDVALTYRGNAEAARRAADRVAAAGRRSLITRWT